VIVASKLARFIIKIFLTQINTRHLSFGTII
jgi:hypothetical protein